jgi:hypothetical protein
MLRYSSMTEVYLCCEPSFVNNTTADRHHRVRDFHSGVREAKGHARRGQLALLYTSGKSTSSSFR